MAEQPVYVVVPPKWVRRAVLAPGLLVVTLLAVVVLPLPLLAGWLLAIGVPGLRPPLPLPLPVPVPLRPASAR